MTITVEKQGERFVLMATSHGYTSVAGPRLLKGTPHPDIRWSHEDEGSAERDAAALQAYLDDKAPAKKRKSTARSAFEE